VNNKKILLAILPYWDPMIPPNGIGHLKSFLQEHGYIVKTVDVIVEKKFQDIYSRYFNLLEEFVPEDQRANFYNIGNEMLQDHLMVHYNYTDEKRYVELVKELVYKTFYVHLDDEQTCRLNRLLDEFYSYLEEYFLELVEKEKPAVIGLTVYKCTIASSLFALRAVRRKFPHIKTVIGGGAFVDTHSIGTPNFKDLLQFSEEFLDKVIIGQGELLFLKYLQGELPDSQRVYTKKDMEGKILEFEDAVIPDFSDFDLWKYPYMAATGSASCPNECSFCSSKNFYGRHRIKDPRQTAEEMMELHKRYGRQLFFMTDAMLNPMVTDLAHQLIKTNASIYYDTFFRIDEESANIENTLLWRRGGLYRVRLGTESGSPRILDLMGKNITPDMIKAAVSSLAMAGIKTTTYWAVGHPGETEADFQATLDLIEELKDNIYQSEANPFLYYYETQTNSKKWADARTLLFPEEFNDMLIFKTWTLKLEPLREEVFRRMFRFTQHCSKLGIPNPYSYGEHIKAEERWKRLHKNAVPSIFEFLSKEKYIEENKELKISSFARTTRVRENTGDFVF
jgi:radical SAM superfamily enzyme YgiQ (UPF0313 family)